MAVEQSLGVIATIKQWQELVGVALGFGAAIITFLMSENRRRLDQFGGIWTELYYNKNGIDEFIESSNIEELMVALRNKGVKRPLWTFSPTTRFYEAHAANLSMSPEIQDGVIIVYNKLFTLRSDIESVSSNVFLEISDEGRESGLRWRYAELGAVSARIGQLLADMRRWRPVGLKLPKDGEFS